ncbi:MAG TPA: hypothetical protein VFA32_20765 [Dehalococcoidia bacterium]|nr:hypothetical protein [Dehalococcoidia bacterium]
MLDPLDQLLIRLGSSELGAGVLSADEVNSWPEAVSILLQREGLLLPAAPASSVYCDACHEGHAEPVETIDEPEGVGLRHYIVCSLVGRVQVDPQRLRQWRLDLRGLALALAHLLGTRDRPREHARSHLWELGNVEISGVVHDVLLAKKGAWSEEGAPRSLAQRWAKPVVLTLVDEAVSDVGAVVLPLRRVLAIGEEGLVLHRQYLEIFVSQATNSRPQALHTFLREGDVWAITFEGRVTRHHATKGLEYIWYLISHQGRAVPVRELVHLGRGPAGSTTGTYLRGMSEVELSEQGLGITHLEANEEVLDAQAIQENKRRLLEIEAETQEASDNGDFGKVEVLEEEREALMTEIKAATGLGGRTRRAPSGDERARINVRMNISNAAGRIAKSDAALARHLDTAIKTGSLCSYEPETPIPWQLEADV